MGLFTREVITKFTSASEIPAYSAERGFTASARPVDLKKTTEIELLKKRMDSARKWQSSAFDYVEWIGELSFAADMVANTISKIRLFAGYRTAEDTAPAKITDLPDKDVSPELKQAAMETVRLLGTGEGGVSGLLRAAALNIFISGECFLTREPAPGDSFYQHDVWRVRSVEEVVIRDGGSHSKQVFIREDRHDPVEAEIHLGAYGTAFLGRIWKCSPRYSGEAISSLKPQLENCDMLLLYDRTKRGVARSKLNSGLLFMPDSISAAGSSDDGELEPEDLEDGEMAPAAADKTDTIEEQLLNAWIEPIYDETAPSSVAPPIVRGPTEAGKAIRHVSFARAFDPEIRADAKETRERILLGIDLPKEVVAGLTDSKYANALVVEDNFYKSHIEPLIIMLVDSFTKLLMVGTLRSMGFPEEEIERVVVWFDPSPVSTKPDKATAATTGYELETISAEAWRRSNGFSETDKPDGLERLQRLAIKKGLVSELVTETLLRSIHPDLFDQIQALAQEQTDPATQAAVQDAVGGGPAPADGPLAEPDAPSNDSAPGVPLIEP